MNEQKAQPGSDNQIIFTRGLLEHVEVREIDIEKRTALFVAATEYGVETWSGREYLRMTGLNLDRFNLNPVVLDTHNRNEAGDIVGRAELTIKNKELLARITFAETERAEVVWKLVSTDFLRTLSIGFMPRAVEVIQEGEFSGTGKNRIAGPARIITEWELYEISVVPVPGDPNALKRNFLFGEQVELAALMRTMIRSLDRVIHKEISMADEKKVEQPPETKIENRAAAQELKTDAPPASSARTLELEDRKRQVMSFCPASQILIAERCLLEGKNVEETRAVLLAEQAKGMKPVGTGEPEKIDTRDVKDDGAPKKIADVSDDLLLRSICG